MGTFSERLRASMDTANMKAVELHERTGISKASISEYLSGNYEPKQRNIFKIAQALNVSPSYLMGVNDDPQPPVQSPAPTSGDLPTLTQRDERQIAKDLEDMLHSLKGSAAMGELEDEEDMELLKASLLQAMTLSKRIAKKNFTPKKYRK